MSQRLEEARGLLRGPTPDLDRVAMLFQADANAGDTSAMLRCAVFAAGGIGQPKDWAKALNLLRQAAAAGDVSAQAQLALLGGEAIDLEGLFEPPPLEPLSDLAMVGVVRGFAPPAFAAWIIGQGGDRLEPGLASNMRTGGYEVRGHRTAMTCGFGPLKRDLIVAVLQERAARVSGIPIAQHEAPMLISYEPGQRYDAHFDFIPPKLESMRAELERQGQRTTTFVTYLSDRFEGGATHFPTLGLSFRGGVGDALVFANVLADGSPDRRMLHAGLPPTSGRKWVLSQWLRNRPQPLR